VHGLGDKNPFFTDRFSVTNPLLNSAFTLEVIIDRSIIEVFLDGGKNSAIATFFPEGKLDTLEVTTSGISGGAQVSVEVWSLKDA